MVITLFVDLKFRPSLGSAEQPSRIGYPSPVPHMGVAIPSETILSARRHWTLNLMPRAIKCCGTPLYSISGFRRALLVVSVVAVATMLKTTLNVLNFSEQVRTAIKTTGHGTYVPFSEFRTLGCSSRLASVYIKALNQGFERASERLARRRRFLGRFQELHLPDIVTSRGEARNIAIFNTGSSRGLHPNSPAVQAMQNFVKGLQAHNLRVSIFAVLDVLNNQKPLCAAGQLHNESTSWRDDPSEVGAALRMFSADHVYETFLDGADTCAQIYELIETPEVKDAIKCSAKTRCSGSAGQSCKNMVAYDRMILREQVLNSVYQYVIRVRPDVVYHWQQPSLLSSLTRSMARGALGLHAFVANDVFTLMDRRLARYFAVGGVLWNEHISVCRESHQQEWGSFIQNVTDEFHLRTKNSLLFLPLSYMALSGALISGVGLEFRRWNGKIKPCSSSLDYLMFPEFRLIRYVADGNDVRYCSNTRPLISHQACSALCET